MQTSNTTLTEMWSDGIASPVRAPFTRDKYLRPVVALLTTTFYRILVLLSHLHFVCVFAETLDIKLMRRCNAGFKWFLFFLYARTIMLGTDVFIFV